MFFLCLYFYNLLYVSVSPKTLSHLKVVAVKYQNNKK